MDLIKGSGEIKQIIVITDGRSNIGGSPIEAAARANKLGAVVSTIAIINNDGSGDERDIEEVEGIARAGCGLCEYTHIENLGRTMKMMTQKTAQKTIEQIVSRQLKSIVGVDMQALEPNSRFKIVDFIEKYGDSINLKCIIALDTSGSMKNKLDTAKKSLYDLMESLKYRQGKSSIAVISYPGVGEQACSVVCDFTEDSAELRERIEIMRAGGGTPTGPAIDMAVRLMLEEVGPSNQGRLVEEIESCYV